MAMQASGCKQHNRSQTHLQQLGAQALVVARSLNLALRLHGVAWGCMGLHGARRAGG